MHGSQNTSKLLGFTLVELIVVITIVGILSTVGFVSYSGYLSGARDSNRMSQLTKISDSLQVYAATKSLPLPDKYVEIQASGSTIAYQGEVGVDVLETIDYTNGGTDPKDDSYYTYYLTKDRKSLQLMALMEEQSSVVNNSLIPSSYAADYTDRFPRVYGKKLGTITQVDTNTPIQQLSQYQSTPFDVVTESSTFIAHISNDEKLTGTGQILRSINPIASCNRIKQLGGSYGNGYYTIADDEEGSLEVYCNMEIYGGGWTLYDRGYLTAVGSTQDIRNENSRFQLEMDLYNYFTDTNSNNFKARYLLAYNDYNSNGHDIAIEFIATYQGGIEGVNFVGSECIDVIGVSGVYRIAQTIQI